MKAKPKHLAPTYGAQFKEESVVDAYAYRPPYPDELFQILMDLMPGAPRRVLDVGCGTGYLSRPLTQHVQSVDAVDFSAHMITQGKKMPFGDAPNLNWILGSIEEVTLTPPYDLITAGESLHWMDWDVVMPLFKQILVPNGYLAIVNKQFSPVPWSNELWEIMEQFRTNQSVAPFNLVDELSKRGLFTKHGEKTTAPVPFQQTVDAYIESFHSSNGFSRERMGDERAAGFDTAVSQLVSPYCENNQMEIQISGLVVWGLPHGIK